MRVQIVRALIAALAIFAAPIATAQTADELQVRADASSRADPSFSEVLRERIKAFPSDGTWSTTFEVKGDVDYKAIAIAARACLAPRVAISTNGGNTPAGGSSQSGDFAGASFRQSAGGTATLTLQLTACDGSGDLVELRLLADAGASKRKILPSSSVTLQEAPPRTAARADPGANGRAMIAMALNNMANGGVLSPPAFASPPPRPVAQRIYAPSVPRQAGSTPAPVERAVPSPQPTAASSNSGNGYRHHQELVATKCLTFHGPIDIYGEQVTNNCTYSVAYAFCVVHATNTALVCKSGDDISAGADTLAGGKTESTGWLTPQAGFRTFWIACRGTIGSVQPVLTSTESGKCMSY